jgi:hypothetical protein
MTCYKELAIRMTFKPQKILRSKSGEGRKEG